MRAMISSDVRQSWMVISHAASGDIVIGAMPMPADTSETASPRCVSNQPVTAAIIGANTAAVAPPTSTPKTSWNSRSVLAWLASARLAARMTIRPAPPGAARTGRTGFPTPCWPPPAPGNRWSWRWKCRSPTSRCPSTWSAETPAVARRMFCSANIGPTICNPIGRPSINPQGTEAAGWRVRLNGHVNGVQSNHWGKRVMSGVSTPAAKAVMGTVGVSSRS